MSIYLIVIDGVAGLGGKIATPLGILVGEILDTEFASSSSEAKPNIA